MRKPREFSGYGPVAFCDDSIGKPTGKRRVFVGAIRLSAKQLRAYAAWLLKAADWLEWEEGGNG